MITRDQREIEERHLPKVGDVFASRYEIEALLGEGGFGAVFAARDLQLDREVAVKVLVRDLGNATALARFVQEARAAAALASDHVAIVHEVAATVVPYIVMERLHGSDLQDELTRRGRLPVAEAVGFVLQAALGVAHAHARGIVHRDLKPRNLFLTTRDDGMHVVKIVDFGIAKSSTSELTETGTTLGTPRYMAPEQLRSSRTVDTRTDIWALGVVLYELVTGSPIFDALSGLELAAQIVVDPHVPLRARDPALSAELEAAIDRCLAKEPDDRYDDLAAFARAIAPFADDPDAIVARIAHVLEAGEALPQHRSAPARDPGARERAAAATARVGNAPTVATPGARPRSRRAALLGGLALAAAAGSGVAVWQVSGERHASAAPADAALDASVIEPVVADAAAVADAVVVVADAVVADVPVPVDAGSRPHRPTTTKPAGAETSGISNFCINNGTTVPTFLVAGGPRNITCARVAELGCAGLAARCAIDAVTDAERQTCRTFLVALRGAEICR